MKIQTPTAYFKNQRATNSKFHPIKSWLYDSKTGPFFKAIQKGDLATVVTKADAGYALLEKKQGKGLMLAIQEGNKEAFDKLLEIGAGINEGTLRAAINNGRMEMLSMLLTKKDLVFEAILIAIKGANQKAFDFLIDKVNKSYYNYLLLNAVKDGTSDMVTTLIRKGASIDVKQKDFLVVGEEQDDWNLLIFALERKDYLDYSVTKALLENGGEKFINEKVLYIKNSGKGLIVEKDMVMAPLDIVAIKDRFCRLSENYNTQFKPSNMALKELLESHGARTAWFGDFFFRLTYHGSGVSTSYSGSPYV